MIVRTLSSALLALALSAAASDVRADDYTLDPAHAAVTFKVAHGGVSWTCGRFKDLSGSVSVDADNPSAMQFAVKAKSESLDTDNAKRDEHLRRTDFFNTRQFPAVSFRSTAVKAVEPGPEVTGDLSLHGVT